MSFPRNKVYALKRSHHDLVETMRAINLPNPEGPLPGENCLDPHARICRLVGLSPMDTASLVPSTLNAERRQVSAVIGQGG